MNFYDKTLEELHNAKYALLGLIAEHGEAEHRQALEKVEEAIKLVSRTY